MAFSLSSMSHKLQGKPPLEDLRNQAWKTSEYPIN